MSIVCRFAPSPTGYLHIGGARTALFNWLAARHEGGRFLLRIEDTDQQRNVKEATDSILEGLKWLGLDWDGEVLFQSERLDIYREHAERLKREGTLYPEEGPEGTAWRFRMPKEDITFEDAVRGRITYPAEQMEDFIAIRSNGIPTYNFSCVIDDHATGITHVIRGDDHLANTPKQIAVYRAFGWTTPVFAHVPMIHGEDGSKLSKRHGAVSVLEFRKMGYLPEALMNFIALLGWSPGDDREIMDKEELIRAFTIDRIKKTSAIFDMRKLEWMNQQYIMKSDAARLADELLEVAGEERIPSPWNDSEYVRRVVELYRERAKRLTDILEAGYFFFTDRVEADAEAVGDVFRDESAVKVLAAAVEALESLDEWKCDRIEETLRALAEEKDLKLKAVCQPIRVAVSGGKVSPPIFETLWVLGRKRSLERMRTLLDALSQAPLS